MVAPSRLHFDGAAAKTSALAFGLQPNRLQRANLGNNLRTKPPNLALDGVSGGEANNHARRAASWNRQGEPQLVRRECTTDAWKLPDCPG